MENGSEPQPWHCPPFVEGATYGLELVYHYDVECHVINDDGDVRFEWDYAREPGGVMGPDEFGVFAPRPNKFYFFASLVDLQPPPGYVIRTQPHPRFYTDDTGTVPAAVVGHVQSAWWPKKLFVVMKAPRIGERHIFRKGDPYVQLLIVPQKADYELIPMTPEENAKRREMESKITLAKSFIAKNVWQNPGGAEFNDHYRTLARALARGEESDVCRTIDQAVDYVNGAVPTGKSVSQYLELAFQFQKQGKLLEAREALFRVRMLAPANPEAASRLGIVAGSMGLPELAVQMMSQAVAIQPRNPAYRNNLGVALRKTGRLAEAEAAFKASLEIQPSDSLVMSNLGMTIAEQGKMDEGLALCRRALEINRQLPVVHYRAGLVLAQLGNLAEARTNFQAALALDANYSPAIEAMENLDRKT